MSRANGPSTLNGWIVQPCEGFKPRKAIVGAFETQNHRIFNAVTAE